ncbi:VRR-NUC domain-containing protein [Clostridium sp.]|uniref:VRR-NUC domain-containing protein n=1 Tax=Clostridium sp. TaxID=1506 RepID=UPI001D98827D|nr:VRR-NUC domain-containing protein [Clostridium sp.]MBS5308768.1 VRR-NUC domain-containing protein [Clostridium sp.]
MKESQEQTFLFQWANLARCKYPELELLHHIPNGGKRNAREAAALKRQGVKAGVPDICLPVAIGEYHGLYIELKVGKNKTSKHQDEWIQKLRNENYCVEVSYGWQEARDTIEDYLEGLM